jgi:hypothetical protein
MILKEEIFQKQFEQQGLLRWYSAREKIGKEIEKPTQAYHCVETEVLF